MFSTRQVGILVLAIVTVLAFLQTSQPVATVAFWRQFGRHLFVHVGVAAVVTIILGSYFYDDSSDD